MLNMPIKQTVTYSVLAFIFLVLFFGSWTVIGAGERGVVLRLGAVQDKIFGEGLHFKWPMIEQVKTLDIKTQKESANAIAASKDLQTVTAQIALNYHLDADRVNKLWQNLGSQFTVRIIDPAIQEAVKAATANYTAEELITKRSEVKDAVKAVLTERLVKDFIMVDDVSIVNFDFSNSFNEAIEAKVTAEQNALAAKNKLEQIKYEAEQRVVTAKGEAEAIKIQAEAIQSQGGAAYVNLKAIEKWNGVLPTYMMGNSVPFVNLK